MLNLREMDGFTLAAIEAQLVEIKLAVGIETMASSIAEAATLAIAAHVLRSAGMAIPEPTEPAVQRRTRNGGVADGGCVTRSGNVLSKADRAARHSARAFANVNGIPWDAVAWEIEYVAKRDKLASNG